MPIENLIAAQVEYAIKKPKENFIQFVNKPTPTPTEEKKPNLLFITAALWAAYLIFKK